MSTPKRDVIPDRLRIEQAVAMGRSLEWMLTQLGATTKQIDDTLAYLDRVNRENDGAPYRPRTIKHGTMVAQLKRRAASGAGNTSGGSDLHLITQEGGCCR